MRPSPPPRTRPRLRQGRDQTCRLPRPPSPPRTRPPPLPCPRPDPPVPATSSSASISTEIRGIKWLHMRCQNGIVQVNISNPEGIVTGIQYNGVDNLLKVLNKESDIGYCNLVWDEGGNKSTKKGTNLLILLVVT